MVVIVVVVGGWMVMSMSSFIVHIVLAGGEEGLRMRKWVCGETVFGGGAP